MPLHSWQFHHLALGNRKGRGERISSWQRAVRDIMGEDWNVRMRNGVTNVVDSYTDVPTDHQLDLEFRSKEWVTGGFCGVRLSSAPVWGVAALQVEFFLIDHQPLQFLPFFNCLHTCFNF